MAADQIELHEEIAAMLSGCEVVDVGLLFGSVAEGTPRVESDVDVAVFGKRTITAEEKMSLIEQIAEAAGRPVDLVDLRTVNPTLLKRVILDGDVVYKSNDSMYVQLLMKLVYDQSDWQPLRRRMLKERRERWIGT